MTKITAILCVYKRAHNFEKQIIALMGQSTPIDNYIIWVNQTEGEDQSIVVPHEIIEKTKIIHSYSNLGVRARFYTGLNAHTDYVFIVDDDVIPGRLWVEKCVALAEQEEGIYGCWGSLFNSIEVRKDRTIVDEKYPFEGKKKIVDMSGRSWFMNRFILNYIAYEIPPNYPICGEELWISYMAKKHGGINTFIPEMKEDEPEGWGNIEPSLGIDRVANHNQHKDDYQEFYIKAIEHGFYPLSLRQ